MKEAKKETQRIKAYRALIEAGRRGVTNGEFCYRHRLPCTYRTRVSELREEMHEKFGIAPGGDWIPGKEVGRDEDGTIWRWHLVLPLGADPRDPLGLLNLDISEKKLATGPPVVQNEGYQMEIPTRQTGGDHEQDGTEGSRHGVEAG